MGQGGLGMTGSQRRCWLFRESSKEIFLENFIVTSSLNLLHIYDHELKGAKVQNKE